GLIAFLHANGRLALLPIATAWFAAAMISVLFSGVWAWMGSDPQRITWKGVTSGWGTASFRGLRALTTVALSLLLVRCDVYMLGPMVGMAVVGQISVASTLAEWLWYVPSILSNLLFAASAADAQTRSVDQIARATRSLIALLTPTSVILLCVGKPLVHVLYGSAYGQAGTLFLFLVP